MGYTTKTVRSIIQGESQSDDVFMIDGQCRQQLNMIASPIEGLVKRPAMVYNRTYNFLDTNKDYKWFNLEVLGLNYEFILGNDNIYIVTDEGLKQTIPVTGNIKYYLSRDLDPNTDDTTIDLKNIDLYYINDQIYLLNKEVVVRQANEDVKTHATSCAIWTTGVSTNKVYTATVSVYRLADDKLVYSTTGDMEVTTAANTKGTLVTSTIAGKLKTDGKDLTDVVADTPTWFTKGVTSEVITCKLTDEFRDDYYIAVESSDDAANTYLKSYSDSVLSVLDLPRFALDGMRAKISTAEGDVDDWYVNFNADEIVSPKAGEKIFIQVNWRNKSDNRYLDIDTETRFQLWNYTSKTVDTPVKNLTSTLYDFYKEDGTQITVGTSIRVGKHAEYITAKRKNFSDQPRSGIWEESALPGSNNLDTSTLPVILDADDVGVWSITQEKWEPRAVGDEKSAPMPLFVNKTINSLHEQNGRMLVTTGDNVMCSTTNDMHNWFRKTATKIQVTDPFPLSASKTAGTLLQPINLNGELFIWGDQDQLKVVGDTLAIGSSALAVVSGYTSSDVKPIVTGNVIHFIAKSNQYNQLYSYAAKNNSQRVYQAESVSAQISTKLPGTVKQIISDYNMNSLLVQLEEQPNKLFLYNFYNVDGKLQQSAWSELDFGFNIEDMFIQDNLIKMITNYDGAYRALSLDLQDLVRPNIIHLDMLQEVTLINGVADVEYINDDFVVVDNDKNLGNSIEYTRVDNKITVPSLTGHATYNVVIGTQFSTLLEPRLVVEVSDQGFIKHTTNIKLNRIGLVLGQSGEFTAHILGNGADIQTEYNKTHIPSTIYDNSTQATTIPVSVRARSDQNLHVLLSSTTHLPFTIRGMYLQYRSSQRGTII